MGEAAILRATLVNTSLEEFTDYPGVVVQASDARVSFDAAPWMLYAIAGRSTVTLEMPVTAELAAGERFTFTLRTTALHCAKDPGRCISEDTYALPVKVE